MRNIFATSLLLIFAFGIAGCAGFSGKNEKHDCSAFSNLPKDAVAIWQAADPLAVKASEQALSPVSMTVGKRADVALIESANMKIAANPPKGHQPPTDKKTYGGHIQFKTADKSDYTIATNKGLWIEVIDLATNKTISASKFEMQADCDLMHKAVRFPLEANHMYDLQMTGSKSETVSVLILPSPK